MDRPSEREAGLLGHVAEGFAASGDWPTWQYVLVRQGRAGTDGEAVLRGLPEWQYSYRSVWTGTAGAAAPPLDARVHLTVHGMIHSDHTRMSDLVRSFLAALQIAQLEYHRFEPSPTAVQELLIDGTWLTEKANIAAGTALSPQQLRDTLHHEPATWSTVRDHGDSFTWDLTNSRIHRYRGVTDAHEYLVALEDEIGLRALLPAPEPLPIDAIPQSVDRLSLVWKLVFGEWLLTIDRLSIPISLTRPVNGSEEFEARCSALADLIFHFDVKPRFDTKERSGLGRMKACIEGRYADDASRALGALVSRVVSLLRVG